LPKSILLPPKRYNMKMETPLAWFVKSKRRSLKLTQVDLAEKAGVGLRFVRDLEQGKPTLRLDKVNQVLDLFGCEVGAVRKEVGHE
jgi:y4mF family transcriptional regulator